MPLDPLQDLILHLNPHLSLPARIANIERLLTLLAKRATVQTSVGTPTLATRDGTLDVDTNSTANSAYPASGPKLWVRVNNAYHYVGLT